MGLLDFLVKRPDDGDKDLSGHTATSVVAAVRALSAAGDLKAAVSMANAATAHFPYARRVVDCYHQALRALYRDELVEKKQACRGAEEPKPWIELAELYLEVGDHHAVMCACEHIRTNYPHVPAVWFVSAKMHLRRFRSQWTVRDGELAVSFLEHAVELNRYYYEAWLLLAEFYCEIGHRRRGMRCCEAVLSFAPGDQRVGALMHTAASLDPACDKRFDQLLREYAQAQHVEKCLEARPLAGEQPLDAQLLVDLPRLQDLLGSVAAHVGGELKPFCLGPDLEAICGHVLDDPRTLAALRELVLLADQTCLWSEIGRCQYVVGDCEERQLVLIQFGRLWLGYSGSSRVAGERLVELLLGSIDEEFYL